MSDLIRALVLFSRRPPERAESDVFAGGIPRDLSIVSILLALLWTNLFGGSKKNSEENSEK